MKKGFTLIELLIVMVIVSLLVTVAMPAYKTSMEKGRGLEAMANAQAVTDAANVFYIKNGNSYVAPVGELKEFVLGDDGEGAASLTENKFFEEPAYSISASIFVVSFRRKNGAYTIRYASSNGMLNERTCTGNIRYCKALGLKTY